MFGKVWKNVRRLASVALAMAMAFSAVAVEWQAVQAAPESIDLMDGLQAWYRFDETEGSTGRDWSGKNRPPAVLNGGALLTAPGWG